MPEDNKIDELLINKLHSADTSIVFEALRKIKEKSTVKIIPHLFDLINEDTQSIIKKDILRIICDIKERKAVPVLINEIQKRNFGSDTSEVVSTFWQSRLDFSKYLSTFIRIFVKEDYQTAIEAFTVVEESICRINTETQQECLNILKTNADKISKEKLPLYKEIVILLETASLT
jgi:hypothetical protein